MFVDIDDFYHIENTSLINLNMIPSMLQDEEWFINIKDYIDETINLNYYDYEFLSKIIKKSIESESESVLLIQKMVKNLFIRNNYKYKTIYNTTVLEYNPIWNVDGTETLRTQRERINTGTQGSQGSNNLTDTFNNVTDTNNSESNTYKTTYDSNNPLLTEKESNNDSNVKSGNETHNTITNNTRTDNLNEKETYSETKIRGGNIGVTMTQQLIEAERKVADFSFLDMVCKDIISEVCVLCG